MHRGSLPPSVPWVVGRTERSHTRGRPVSSDQDVVDWRGFRAGKITSSGATLFPSSVPPGAAQHHAGAGQALLPDQDLAQDVVVLEASLPQLDEAHADAAEILRKASAFPLSRLSG